ncbi:uracil-xanthine permease family protein [Cellulomonas fengjieae]|uniref:Nitrate reductase n=1 Tax=Cellulomonas fengjieae TaxID=2819978 RepID=A0ABS3SJE2_9CELL|nr:solute carrier family 23 protein [Cellulomonas fengjieae]MBO3085870.1 nitrate reductase [Cellulomonas fengjieae]MBO3102979.1 nitrate reductase [Cellulomonas fengjieae]QVI67435.1 NCS2 family nucleobase:cation symporter [Cellulomonas fengjieae]
MSIGWRLHGDGRTIPVGEVVAPDERLSWPRTIGIGMQHVVAMFGATFLVPLLTGFSPATTLFFSAVGTVIFLLVTRNRLPSYLGSSFAFIAPISAATASGGQSVALGGIVVVGVLLAVIGAVVHVAGTGWIDRLMPPVVTGTIVALIGLNLAPTAWGTCTQSVVDGEIVESCTNGFRAAPVTALVTLLAIILCSVLFRGILGRLSILVGVLVGYLVATLRGEVDFSGVTAADWVGFPEFVTPTFDITVLGLFVPVVLVLVAENIGHVKSVAAMTGTDMDPLAGRALFSDGIATAVAGLGGGSGTTTYAENIGVMAATKVYSTAAYWVAAATALVLSLSPKFGAVVASIPAGVLGGATTVLYGMIGILGARIWVQNRVDFSDAKNLTTAAVALVVGIANFTWAPGDLEFGGIALGTAAALGVYHLMRVLEQWRGTGHEPASPGSVPTTESLDR